MDNKEKLLAQGGETAEILAVKAQKEQRWQQVAAAFAEETDALGHKIDAGILDTVVALNVLDISTFQSCEGHLDWATGAPYIDIAAPNTGELEQRVAKAFDTAKQQEDQGLPLEEVIGLYKKAHEIRAKVSSLHLAERNKVMSYLEDSYRDRKVPYDRRLTIQSLPFEKSRIESQGAGLQQIALPEVKQQNLQEYQEEMRTFTTFLKEKYFSS